MSGGITHRIFVDDPLESYQTFFDHTWVENIDTMVAGTKLERPIFNLCVSWKAAANTCILPWLICDSVSEFSVGFTMGREPFAAQVIEACAKRLPNEMSRLSNMQRKELIAAVKKIGTELRDRLAQQAHEFTVSANQMWMAFLNGAGASEFRLSIWGSQRTAFGAIYHAYENLLREAVSLASGRPQYKVRKVSTLLTDCANLFGQPIADMCLADPDVRAARLVRNALAHNGGKETAELCGVAHGIRLENGELQIMAPDTRRLFDLLKVRVFKLAEKAVTLPTIR
jgi:hypothetical protein